MPTISSNLGSKLNRHPDSQRLETPTLFDPSEKVGLGVGKGSPVDCEASHARVAGIGVGVNVHSEITSNDRKDAGTYTELRNLEFAKCRDRVQISESESVEGVQRGEGTPVDHESVHKVAKQHSQHITCAAFLLGELEAGSSQSPHSVGLIEQETTSQVEVDSERVERFGVRNLNSESEAPFAEHVLERRREPSVVNRIPGDEIAVVDIRRKNRAAWRKDGAGSAFKQNA